MVLTNTTGVIVELNAEVKALFGQGQHEVEMHGGTVIAQSHGLGAGSEFIVRIPLLTAITAPHEFGGALAPGAARTIRRGTGDLAAVVHRRGRLRVTPRTGARLPASGSP
jgi:hypothetical protein